MELLRAWINLPFQPLTAFLNVNTALVLGLKPNSNELKIQMKTKESTFTAEYQNGEWEVSGQSNVQIVELDTDALSCSNCGRGHRVEFHR